jgi:hypothetical protein
MRAWEEPLVNIGVAIRKRFWENAKERRDMGIVNEITIETGNKAAHQGNIVADTAMILLGRMMDISSSIRTAKEVIEQFETLYGVRYELVKGRWGSFRTREQEILNLSATVASCCSTYFPWTQTWEDGDRDSVQFCRLTRECVAAHKYFFAAFSPASKSQKAFDGDPEIGCKLQEMRVVVGGIVKANFGRRRSRL